jgi:hypothetical protein
MATTKTMATSKKAPATIKPNVMQISGKPEDRERLFADLTVEGLFTNAVILQSYSREVAGDIGITAAAQSLRRTVTAVNRGDLRCAETMLVGQAGALNVIFAELARRAALNMGEYPEAFERYMRLALKAQGQCRATLETLAAIKNPPVFARQANINHGGQQQVNNLPAPETAKVYAGAALADVAQQGGGVKSLPALAPTTALDSTPKIFSTNAESQQTAMAAIFDTSSI